MSGAADATRTRLKFTCAWFCLLTLIFNAPLSAQSGRKRQPPQSNRKESPTPAPSVRRPASSSVTDNLPGQPATPDTPGTLAAPPVIVSTSEANSSMPTEIDPDEIVRVNSNLVPVTATVIDQSGKAITNLELKDFELRVDGEIKAIGELSRAETPVRMAVLFDNSGSAQFSRELEQQAAVRFFRNVLRPVDRAAIFSIWTDPILVQPLTGDVQQLVRVVDSFSKPEGGTAVLDTVAEAAEYLRLQSGRKVIVIISDGIDTTSRRDFAETLRAAQAADCQVYAIQTGVVESANLRDLVAERRLHDLAEQTGGAVYVPKSISDLAPAFAQLAADLSHQYVLSYYPTEERRDNLFRVINVRIPARQNVRVRARRGYYPKKRIEDRG